MTNQSIKNAFDRFWQHVVAKIGDKADIDHSHSWNDLDDKPFGEAEDGAIETIDPKYLPETNCDWNKMKNKPFYSEATEIVETVYEQSVSDVTISENMDIVEGNSGNMPIDGEGVPNLDCSYVEIWYESPSFERACVICDTPDEGWTGWTNSEHDIYIEMTYFDYESRMLISNLDKCFPKETGGVLTVIVKMVVVNENIKPLDPKFYSPVVVTLTETGEGEYALDKTFEEIRTALDKGHEVLLASIEYVSAGDIRTMYYRLFFSTMDVLTFVSIKAGANDSAQFTLVSVFGDEYEGDRIDVEHYLLPKAE